MGDQRPQATNQGSLTNDEIVTERRLPRRAFLSATGVFLAGGAAAVVAGARSVAQQVSQSDQPKQDPDKPRPADPDKARAADPDKARAADPDKKRKKQSDPDKPRPADPAPPQ